MLAQAAPEYLGWITYVLELDGPRALTAAGKMGPAHAIPWDTVARTGHETAQAGGWPLWV